LELEVRRYTPLAINVSVSLGRRN